MITEGLEVMMPDSAAGSRLGSGDARVVRRVHIHDSGAPGAAVVSPSVFVAARDDRGLLLLVRRSDSGAWELPGGQVDIGESAMETAMRETAEESGVSVRITGIVGLFTDPSHIVVVDQMGLSGVAEPHLD